LHDSVRNATQECASGATAPQLNTRDGRSRAPAAAAWPQEVPAMSTNGTPPTLESRLAEIDGKLATAERFWRRACHQRHVEGRIDDGGLNELSHISVDRDAVHPCDDPHRRRRRSCIRVASARSAIALTSPRGRVGLVGSSLVVPELEAALVHVNRSPIVGAHQAH